MKLKFWHWILIAWVLSPLVWPGDTPWINDEPLLYGIAKSHHLAGVWPATGLVGSAGTPYGPFPLAVSITLMKFTLNPIWLSAMRGVAVNLASALGLLWLSRQNRSWIGWGVLTYVLAPALWQFSRQVWDNPFLLPLSILVLASAQAFVLRPRAWVLAVLLASSLASFCTHLMALSLLIPVLVWVAFKQGRAFLKYSWVLLPFLYLARRYLKALALSVFAEHAVHFEKKSLWKAWSFGVRGIELFQIPWISWSVALVAVFFIWGVYQTFVEWKTRRALGLAQVSLLVVLFQWILSGISQKYEGLHYFHGTAIAYFVLIWVGMSELPKSKWRPFAQLNFVSVLGAAWIWQVLAIHQNGGRRDFYFGTNVSEQIRIASLLPKDAQVDATGFENWKYWPHARWVLQGIEENSPASGEKWSVGYRDPDVKTAWLKAERAQ